MLSLKKCVIVVNEKPKNSAGDVKLNDHITTIFYQICIHLIFCLRKIQLACQISSPFHSNEHHQILQIDGSMGDPALKYILISLSYIFFMIVD